MDPLHFYNLHTLLLLIWSVETDEYLSFMWEDFVYDSNNAFTVNSNHPPLLNLKPRRVVFLLHLNIKVSLKALNSSSELCYLLESWKNTVRFSTALLQSADEAEF